jgi:hypothetical protein
VLLDVAQAFAQLSADSGAAASQVGKFRECLQLAKSGRQSAARLPAARWGGRFQVVHDFLRFSEWVFVDLWRKPQLLVNKVLNIRESPG